MLSSLSNAKSTWSMSSGSPESLAGVPSGDTCDAGDMTISSGLSGGELPGGESDGGVELAPASVPKYMGLAKPCCVAPTSASSGCHCGVPLSRRRFKK